MLIKFLATTLLIVSCTNSFAESIYITNKNVETITKEQAKSIVIGRTTTLPSGEEFILGIINSKTAEADKAFQDLTGKSSRRIMKMWNKKNFSGKGSSPTEFETFEELVTWTSKTEGAISLIESDFADNTIKVIE
jgi:hypothetical protein